MANLIPPRPTYKKERRTVGFAVLASFLLLFLAKLLGDRLPPVISDTLLLPLIAALAALLPPALVYLLLRGKGFSRSLRFAPPQPRHFPLLVAAFFAMLTGPYLLSVLTGGIDTLGTSLAPFTEHEGSAPLSIILSYLTLALLPALLETFFFFGVLPCEYERRGSFRAYLMAPLLFSLFHFDLKNLPAYLFLGLLLVAVLFMTDSLFSVLVLQALYYPLAFFMTPYMNAFYRFTGSPALFLFILVLILLVSLALFFRFGARTYRLRDEQGIKEPRRAVPYAVQFYTTLDALSDPAILLSLTLAVIGIILF